MHLHEFLSHVHDVVKPQIYLEVGVQHGTSLNLAHAAELAIGVDPAPLVTAVRNQTISSLPSDQYFWDTRRIEDAGAIKHPRIDLGFIDGLHHFEQALRDFLNIEHWGHDGTVIVFDDVLPRNQEEAQRDQIPGDWTGDVWKATQVLLRYRQELTIMEVNTQPTGTLVVYGFGSGKDIHYYDLLDAAITEYRDLTVVPDNVINRAYAMEPAWALSELKGFIDAKNVDKKPTL
jgi:predicted O-methyltransferase YrrM